MKPPDSGEGDLFSHSVAGGTDGYVIWRQQRADSTNRLAELSGLPLNHLVEVTLKDGVRLRGLLRLKQELLFQESKPAGGLELTVDGVEFRSAEIEFCVRTD